MGRVGQVKLRRGYWVAVIDIYYMVRSTDLFTLPYYPPNQLELGGRQVKQTLRQS
jgi:hypothetical protein